MFHSNKNNLLVISIPKTASSSIERALLEYYGLDGQIHGLIINGVEYKSESFSQGTIGHARAKEFKAVLGDKEYNKLITIAFLRNPYAKLVSAYHFTKSNPIFTKHKGKKKWLKRTMSYTLGVLAAKLLPFSLWIYIYPYRSSSSYILDSSGKCIVTYVGSTENLEDDLNKFLEEPNIHKEGKKLEIRRLNTSKHNDYKEYYTTMWSRKLAYRKMQTDIVDYEKRYGKIQL
jgi:hypothetical protein